MKKSTFLLLVLMVLPAMAQESTKPKNAKEAEKPKVSEAWKKLEGDWRITREVGVQDKDSPWMKRKHGYRIKDEYLKDTYDGVVMSLMDTDYQKTYWELDDTKEPHRIDFVVVYQAGNTYRCRGIYKIENDRLTIAMTGEPNGERPKNFEPNPNNKIFGVRVYERFIPKKD